MPDKKLPSHPTIAREEALDLDRIKTLAAQGEIDSSLDNLLMEAWEHGWSSGFAFQKVVEDKLKEDKEQRGNRSEATG